MCFRTSVAVCLVSWLIGLAGCRSTVTEKQTTAPAQQPTQEQRQPTQTSTAYYYYSAAQLALKSAQIDQSIRLLEKALEFDPESSFLTLELADLWVFMQKFDKALALIEQILKKQPDHLEALTMAGRIYQQLDKLPKAKQAFEKALTLNPNDQSVYLSLGRLYWDEKDFVHAERVFQLMAKNFPDAYAAHYFYGKALVSQGKRKEATDAFNRSLALDPTLEEPRLELIEIYKTQNRAQSVIQAYQALMEYNPDSVRAILGLAVYYHQTGHSSSGLPLLADLGLRSHDEPEILGLVFESYLETQQFEIAIWVLNGMIKGYPDGSDLHYFAGVAYDGVEKQSEAIQHLIRVMPGSRFYSDAVLHAALLYHDTGQLEPAIEKIRQGLNHDAKNADYYFYLGMFYEELERFEDALTTLRQGLSLDEKNAQILFRLGVVLDKLGRRAESIQAMQTVVQVTPEDADALNYLGYTYADMGIRLDEAETLIRSALKFKPEDGYIIDSLGWVYFQKGEYGTALKWLLKAVERVSNDPVIFEHLGDVYQKLGQKKKAINYFNRSLGTHSKNQERIQQKIRELTVPQK